MNQQIINLETGLARVRNNQVLYNRLLAMFLASEKFLEFETVYKEKKIVEAGEVMHAIKGMTGNLSLDKLTSISTDLMNLFRTGQDNPEMVEQYRNILQETIAKVNEVIGK